MNELQELIYKDLLNIVDEETQMAILEQNWTSIKFIRKPSEQVQFEALRKDVYSIQYIKKPSEQVQFAAVMENGNSIEFIKTPSEQVQLEAVKQDGYSINFIKKPSEKAQLEAVKKNIFLIQYIKKPSESVQLEIIKINEKHSAIFSTFMKYCFPKINNSKALTLLYNIVPDEYYKEIIKKHPNYKTDAQLILKNINKNNNLS